jgi:hypothetical protein
MCDVLHFNWDKFFKNIVKRCFILLFIFREFNTALFFLSSRGLV